MKIIAPLIIALTLLWGGPAVAASDNANKDHSKHGNNGGANGNGGSSSTGGEATTGPRAPSPTDQNAALDAVSVGAALPLRDIVELAAAKWGGRAIDAKLLNVHSRLVYQLTMLSDQGVSRRVYYDALSGRSVKAP